jgi:hypothetical protein
MSKSADIALELAKQLITLNSGGLLIVCTFKEKFVKSGSIDNYLFGYFVVSLISLVFSLASISTLAGKSSQTTDFSDIYQSPLREIFGLSFSTYILSLLLLVISSFQLL